MFGRKSEDYGRRRFSLQPSGRRLAKHEVVDAHPDVQCPVRMPSPRNLFLTCFKIS